MNNMIEKMKSIFSHQTKVFKLFENTISKNRLHHTYLFEGDFKTNALECSLLISGLIYSNYLNIPFDLSSEVVGQIYNKKHPNIYIIEAINGIVKKEQIQELMHEFSLTPLQKGPRIYIINGIDKCNLASSNTLLKFLEETTDNCYGILICDNAKSVIETIRSRAILVRLNKSNSLDIYNQLVSVGYRKDICYFASILSSDVIDSKNLIANSKLIALTDGVKKVFDDLYFSQSAFVDFTTLVSPILKESSEEYDYYDMFFEIIIELNRMLLKMSNTNITSTIYSDSFKDIIKCFSKTDIYVKCVNKIDVLLQYKERLKYNVNIDLQFASMFSLLGENNE